MKTAILRFLVLNNLFAIGTMLSGQTNLLQNTNADLGSKNWRVYGQSTVEEFEDSRVFVLRNGGYFLQDVILNRLDVGQYALLIGRGSSERINLDGAITGLPNLYGYMMDGGNPSGGQIYAYLQDMSTTLAHPSRPNEWVIMWGVFQVPEKTGAIRFFLNQAERKGVPHNGSAARFDDLGLYLFDTEREALDFAKAYK